MGEVGAVGVSARKPGHRVLTGGTSNLPRNRFTQHTAGRGDNQSHHAILPRQIKPVVASGVSSLAIFSCALAPPEVVPKELSPHSGIPKYLWRIYNDLSINE